MASKSSQSETIKEAVTAATRAISGNKELEINFLISLTVDDKELISRIKKRSLVSGRVDDQSEEKINNRINVYKNETLPVLNYYKNQNKYHSIDGHGTIENIFDSICSKIDN